jgi:chromosome segregation ATPase
MTNSNGQNGHQVGEQSTFLKTSEESLLNELLNALEITLNPIRTEIQALRQKVENQNSQVNLKAIQEEFMDLKKELRASKNDLPNSLLNGMDAALNPIRTEIQALQQKVENQTSEASLKAIQEELLNLKKAFGNQTTAEKSFEDVDSTLKRLEELQTNLAFLNQNSSHSQFEHMVEALKPVYKRIQAMEEALENVKTETPNLVMERLSALPEVSAMLGKIIGSKSVMELVLEILQKWEGPLEQLEEIGKTQGQQLEAVEVSLNKMTSKEELKPLAEEFKATKKLLESLAKEKTDLKQLTEDMENNKKFLEDLTKKQAQIEKQNVEIWRKMQESAEDLKTWQTNSPSKNQIEQLKNQGELLKDDLRRSSVKPINGQSKYGNPWVVGLLITNLILTVGVGWMGFKTMQAPKAFLVPKTSVRK